nr:hypothetical protein B0A51_10238 [Rachicladosporium sp. CCFEE 5018]
MASVAATIDRESASDHQPLYQYAPLALDEIRLVTLLPGAFDDDIRVKIRHCKRPIPSADAEDQVTFIRQVWNTLPENWLASKTLGGRILFSRALGHKPGEPSLRQWEHPISGDKLCVPRAQAPRNDLKYEAVSYAWGTTADEGYVYVQKNDHLTVLPIRDNLRTALRHLRDHVDPRELWIDALCIDQGNNVERGLQVHQMHHIFQLADRVIIWLGAAGDDSAHALSSLRYLASQAEIILPHHALLNAPACSEPTLWRGAVALPYEHRTIASLIALLRRQWFRRLWVVQEAKLSSVRSIMLCGHHEMTVVAFTVAACLLCQKETLPAELVTLAWGAARNTVPLSHEPFTSSLFALAGQAYTDPRDRIYGALGLAPPSVRSLITPDYEASVAEVYRDACEAITKYTGRLDTLLACRATNLKHSLPSWVNDWSTDAACFKAHIGQAAGTSRLSPGLIVHGSERMAVQAKQCGIIQVIGIPRRNESIVPYRTMRQWCNACIKHEQRGGAAFDLDAFVKTMAMGSFCERFISSADCPSFEEARTRMLYALELTSQYPGSDDEMSAYMMVYRLQCPSMFRTTRGHLGVTCGQIKSGDALYVILGCPMPVLLRARTSETQGYEFVGACYVDGLMDAEALLGKLSNEWNIEAYPEGARCVYRFRNVITGWSQVEDPRLPPLEHPWVELEFDEGYTSADPFNAARFRNEETGEEINYDPRLTPDALRDRGVQIERITLV